MTIHAYACPKVDYDELSNALSGARDKPSPIESAVDEASQNISDLDSYLDEIETAGAVES